MPAPALSSAATVTRSSAPTAWGAKTIKNKNPFSVKRVRLISGRNCNTLAKVGVPNYTDKQQREIIGRIAKCVELSGELSERHEENVILADA